MLRTRALAVVVATLFSGAAHAVTPATPTAPAIADWTLPNGLRVLLLPKPTSPSVAVVLFYHAGSKDELPAFRGIAHLFEHMMFKGTKRVPPEAHARFLNQLGAENNAFTTDDLTGYEEVVPPAALDFALALEADRMRGLALDQAMLDAEREVVKEELRMRVEGSPVMQGVERMMATAFVKHPYRTMPIGTKEMLDAVTVAECKKFYDLFYQPNNATLVLVGNVTEADARALADKHFGPIPRGPAITRQVIEEPPQTELRKARLDVPMAMPLAFGAYHVPGVAHPDMLALKVLQEILSSGESSRLYRRIVRSGLGVYAGGFLFEHEEPGVFVTFAQIPPGGDPAKAQAAFDDEIAKVTRVKVSAAELKKAKNQLAVHALDERIRSLGLASAIGEAALTKGDPLAPFGELARLDAVTADEVLAVAKKYLRPANQTTLAMVPKATPAEPPGPAKQAAKQAAAKPDAAKPAARAPLAGKPLVPPKNLPAPTLSLGEVVRETLPNGMKLLVVPRHDLPLVQATLFLPAGHLDSPLDKMGVAELTAEMLHKGAGKRTALQIAELVDGAGAQLAADVVDDLADLRCRARARDLGLCLDLLADLAMRPTFPEDELQQTRTEQLAQVAQQRDDPPGLAEEHAANLYFGDTDPRGRPLSERSVGGITRKDLVALHATRYRPDGATLIVSGDVELARLKATLMKAQGLGRWAKRGELPAVVRALPAARPLRVRLVDKPDATQTTFHLLGPGIAHRAPELFALEYANYILGGGDFSSRLMKVVRSDGGKVYGVHSIFEKSRDPGLWMVATATRVSESARTLKLVTGEIDKLRREGPTPVELEDTRGNLVGRMTIGLETAGDVASALFRADHDGLPPDHVEKAPARLQAVKLDEVKRAAAQHFSFEVLTAVGPAQAVRPLLEAAGYKIEAVVPHDAAVAAPDRTPASAAPAAK